MMAAWEHEGGFVMREDDEALNRMKLMETTKPCPKCAVPIEKNEGCLHMTCRTW